MRSNIYAEFTSANKIKFCIFCFRLNLVFFILILHGIGALMPWNMFITAKNVSILILIIYNN